MILFDEQGIEMAKTYLLKAAERHGFANEAKNMLEGKNKQVLNTRINMFLCLGINTTGQSVNIHNVYRFIRLGTNRFFLSLKNRFELAECMFDNNLYKGKYNLAMDYYVASAVFDLSTIPDSVLEEWNKMIKPIVIKGRHGIKVVRIDGDENTTHNVKYRWVDRITATRKKKK